MTANGVAQATVVKAEQGMDDKIMKQVEFYFGDINLPRDKFLQEEMKKDDGCRLRYYEKITNMELELKQFKEELKDMKQFKEELKDMKQFKEELKDMKQFKEELKDMKQFKEELKDMKQFKEELKDMKQFTDELKDMKQYKEKLKAVKEEMKNTKESVSKKLEQMEEWKRVAKLELENKALRAELEHQKLVKDHKDPISEMKQLNTEDLKQQQNQTERIVSIDQLGRFNELEKKQTANSEQQKTDQKALNAPIDQ
uniref:HTH La-type RNA-binding domain-containing protein n=1 Tax=Globodera pallida TaxID=36090 RepID=A0A183CEV6_GLOPA